MKKDISIDLIIKMLYKRIVYIIIAAIICAVGAYMFSVYFITPEYTSSLKVYVNSANKGTAETQGGISNASINASQQLVNTYSVILKDRVVLEKVKEKIGNSMSVGQLNAALSLTSVQGTEVMQIAATTPDPKLSSNICNAMAEIAPEFLKKIIQAGSVETIGEALPSGSPSSPNKKKNTALGFIIGFIISTFFFFILELFNTSINNEDDIKEVTGVPVFGEIPTFENVASNKKRNSRSEYINNRIDKTTTFHLIESYKTVRTNLSYSLDSINKKTFLVTSSVANEGKSSTCSNIAIAMAQTGKKVLLVDADIRKPIQHKIFSLDNSKGLSSVLVGYHKITDVINHNVCRNLDVVTSGPTPPNPSELLGNAKMDSLIEELEASYDLIILDTPPVNIVSDALVLSKFVNEVLLVSRYEFTKIPLVKTAVENLHFAKANIIGAVLVDSKDFSKGYGKYRYRYKYYGRYAESTFEAKYGKELNGKKDIK